MNRCEICGRRFEGMIHIIFIPNQEVYHVGFPTGKNYRACLECEVNYLAQYFEMSDKDIDDFVKWILEVERK